MRVGCEDVTSAVVISLDGVDKRGRRVQQSSSEDLQKYYDLHDDDAVTSSQQEGKSPQKSRQLKSAPGGDGGREGEVARSLVGPHLESEEGSGSGSEEGDSDSSTDVEDVVALREPEVSRT